MRKLFNKGENKMKSYNGHRSWNAWNVCLWIYNEENIYKCARDLVKKYGVKKATKLFIRDYLPHKTPDGAIYNNLCVKLALEDMEE